ncbi:MAG: lipopolysaccharide heptosyltransferase II [Pseudolabrys sp.]
MSGNSNLAAGPALIVPYMWIGDFVRCHSVVRVLRAQQPDRPVDLLAAALVAPLADYMPGVRRAIVSDLPRRRIAVKRQRALASTLARERYAQAIILPRTWKSGIAPFLAGIPTRTGFAGEFRFGLLNDVRYGERKLPRMIDQMGTLALPKDAQQPAEWPLPKLDVPAQQVAAWRALRGLVPDGSPVVTLAPGAVGAGKAWPPQHYAELARALIKAGASVWIVGGPGESALAREITNAGGKRVHDLTGNDLRNAVLALAASDVAVTNDSGLMHVAAAVGTPTVAIFGPASPWHWKPLKPLATILEPPLDATATARVRSEGNRAVRHRRTADVPVATVTKTVRAVMKTRAADQ